MSKQRIEAYRRLIGKPTALTVLMVNEYKFQWGERNETKLKVLELFPEFVRPLFRELKISLSKSKLTIFEKNEALRE